MSLRDRLPRLLEIDKEDLPLLQAKASDPTKDQNGSSTSILINTFRSIGVCEFALIGDVESFRHHLSMAAKLGLQLLKRHDAGEPIDSSYVSMLRYKNLFDALAANDMTIVQELAKRLGGRPKIETAHNHPFDQCLGYTLKAFVMGEQEQMEKWCSEFASMCQSKGNFSFAGYAAAFQGILNQDLRQTQEAMSAIGKGHKNLIKRGGVFNGTIDEEICVWGIGMANLARSRGLQVTAVAPFIPAELLFG
jgi:hypothetical protein